MLCLYLLSGSHAEGVGVHRGAMMQQDPGHRLPLLLQVEWFIPVTPALVVLVARPVDQSEHDGDVEGVVIPVLDVPHKHCHWEAGVLRGLDVCG